LAVVPPLHDFYNYDKFIVILDGRNVLLTGVHVLLVVIDDELCFLVFVHCSVDLIPFASWEIN
jgi:hypothetical protein